MGISVIERKPAKATHQKYKAYRVRRSINGKVKERYFPDTHYGHTCAVHIDRKWKIEQDEIRIANEQLRWGQFTEEDGCRPFYKATCGRDFHFVIKLNVAVSRYSLYRLIRGVTDNRLVTHRIWLGSSYSLEYLKVRAKKYLKGHVLWLDHSFGKSRHRDSDTKNPHLFAEDSF